MQKIISQVYQFALTALATLPSPAPSPSNQPNPAISLATLQRKIQRSFFGLIIYLYLIQFVSECNQLSHDASRGRQQLVPSMSWMFLTLVDIFCDLLLNG